MKLHNFYLFKYKLSRAVRGRVHHFTTVLMYDRYRVGAFVRLRKAVL
jgi:hypothetical protein